MSWIASVQNKNDPKWIEKEFDTEEDAYYYAYQFPRWEVFHS